MFIYNISLFLLFATFFQFLNYGSQTLYSFSNLGSTNILTKIFIIVFFSMAGVPPFLGFFAKMIIFVILTTSNFFFLFFFFFTILFYFFFRMKCC